MAENYQLAINQLKTQHLQDQNYKLDNEKLVEKNKMLIKANELLKEENDNLKGTRKDFIEIGMAEHRMKIQQILGDADSDEEDIPEENGTEESRFDQG